MTSPLLCTSHDDISNPVKSLSYLKIPFFVCYLAALWPPLSLSQGARLSKLMLITALLILSFDPKVTGSLVTKLGPKAYHVVGFDPGTFQFWMNALTCQATLPKENAEAVISQVF